VQRSRDWARGKLAGWGRPLAGAALFVVLFENFCCTAPSSPAAELSPIVIGVSNAQSGPASILGQTLLLGSKAYFDLVNQHGGIHGRKIAIILKDDKYEPDPAVLNTNELIEQDNVFFLFDYVGTPTLTRVLPLLQYYGKKGIVNVAPFSGADPQRTPPYDQFVFNIRASYREETRALVDYLYHQGYRRIGFLGQADASGTTFEIGVNAALEEYGLKIVSSVAYSRDQDTEAPMTAQVNLLRAAGAEAVIAVGVSGPCAAFVRDARRSGWNIPIANVSFAGATVMLEKLSQMSQQLGVDLTVNLINSQVVPSIDDNRYPLVAAYRAHNSPERRPGVALEGWLNAVVVTEALRRTGPNPSRQDFIHAMESLHNFDPGLGVKLEFSSTNHQGLHKVWLNQTIHGRWHPVPAP
jgi:branched-chain amino acid transport system substrate-binding protein